MGYYYRDKSTGKINYSPSVGESFETAFGGILGGVGEILGKVALAVIVLFGGWQILKVAGTYLLHQVGILDTDVYVSVADGVDETGLEAVFVSHEKKPEVYSAPVDAAAPAEFHTSTDNHSLFLSYDGMMYDYGAYIIPGMFGDTTPECTFEPSRAVLVTFFDAADGGMLVPASFSVGTETSAEIGWTEVGDGLYAVILPDDASGTGLTITVPGYEAVTLYEDWDSQRLGMLEVRLNVQ